jgi:hypothetical protein
MKIKVTKWNAKEGDTYAANGLIRINANKPEYGSLMLMATTVVITSGFANARNKVAFINGEVAQLETMISEYNLREGVDFSLAVGPHRIVTLEKVESELGDELGYSVKINPTTGEILTKNGEPIYRKTEIVAEGSDIVDTVITFDREAVVDEAKAEFEVVKEDETGK